MIRLARRAWRIARLAVLFFADLTVSGCRVAIAAFGPNAGMSGDIVRFPLDVRSDMQITLLANLICLTPGTLVLDVEDDRSALLVHIMFADDSDEIGRDLKTGLETRIREIWE